VLLCSVKARAALSNEDIYTCFIHLLQSYLLDEGSEIFVTCSKPKVCHVNIIRNFAGLTGLYRVKTARSLISDAKHGFFEHEAGAKADEA